MAFSPLLSGLSGAYRDLSPDLSFLYLPSLNLPIQPLPCYPSSIDASSLAQILVALPLESHPCYSHTSSTKLQVLPRHSDSIPGVSVVNGPAQLVCFKTAKDEAQAHNGKVSHKQALWDGRMLSSYVMFHTPLPLDVPLRSPASYSVHRQTHISLLTSAKFFLSLSLRSVVSTLTARLVPVVSFLFFVDFASCRACGRLTLSFAFRANNQSQRPLLRCYLREQSLCSPIKVNSNHLSCPGH